MFKRQVQCHLKDVAKQYPVVTIIGPRQSGKTTLAKETFPNKTYVNLEALYELAQVQSDPVGFLDRYPDSAIIDEVPCYPLLLSEILVRVDAIKCPGMFILIESHRPRLKGGRVQSLAGRTAIVHLLPLSLQEMEANELLLPTDDLLLQGGFPAIYRKGLDPKQTYRYYVQTYMERAL